MEAFAPGIGASAENFKRLTVRKNLISRRSSLFAKKGYEEQMRLFFHEIRAGKPPSVTADDGARATLTCLKMLESARTMSPCALDWRAELSVPVTETVNVQ